MAGHKRLQTMLQQPLQRVRVPLHLFAIAADFSKKHDIDVLIEKVDKIGLPVVNNHGIFDFKPFVNETDKEWQ